MYTTDRIARMIERYIAELAFPAQPDGLYAPIRYALAEGGKRIRPSLLLAACHAFSDGIEKGFPAAAALEVFHTFTLLHDDIMDNASVRRGKPAVHKQWSANTAILSGDAMVIYAYGILGRCDPRSLPGLLAEFNRMAAEVCEGQQYDMDFERRNRVTIPEYIGMIRLKTACLMACATKMGGMIGGADASSCDALYRFGEELGLAFQIQDDLLDTYGDAQTLGKATGGDILECKKTFLAIAASEAASPAQQVELDTLLHDEGMPGDEKIARVKSLYDQLDVPSRAREAIGFRMRRSLEALGEVDADPVRLSSLRAIADAMMNRNK